MWQLATCHWQLPSIRVNQLSWNLKLRLKQNPLTYLTRRVGNILWYTHLSLLISPNLMMVMVLVVMVVMHETQVREVTSFATHFHLPIWPTHPHCPLTTPELCILHPLWTKACQLWSTLRSASSASLASIQPIQQNSFIIMQIMFLVWSHYIMTCYP